MVAVEVEIKAGGGSGEGDEEVGWVVVARVYWGLVG